MLYKIEIIGRNLKKTKEVLSPSTFNTKIYINNNQGCKYYETKNNRKFIIK